MTKIKDADGVVHGTALRHFGPYVTLCERYLYVLPEPALNRVVPTNRIATQMPDEATVGCLECLSRTV